MQEHRTEMGGTTHVELKDPSNLFTKHLKREGLLPCYWRHLLDMTDKERRFEHERLKLTLWSLRMEDTSAKAPTNMIDLMKELVSATELIR